MLVAFWLIHSTVYLLNPALQGLYPPAAATPVNKLMRLLNIPNTEKTYSFMFLRQTLSCYNRPAIRSKCLGGEKYFRGGQITYTGIMYYSNQFFVGRGEIFFRGGAPRASPGCGPVLQIKNCSFARFVKVLYTRTRTFLRYSYSSTFFNISTCRPTRNRTRSFLR